MTKCTHGTIDGLSVRAACTGGTTWQVDASFTFTSDEDIRVPVTFTVLSAARTRLVTLEKGSAARTRLVTLEKGMNALEFSLQLEDPKRNNPFSFLGTDEAEALIRIDGAEISAPVSFA